MVKLSIGLFGCGTVGGGVCNMLVQKKKFFQSIGIAAEVRKICVQNLQKKRDLLEDKDSPKPEFVTDYQQILQDSSINCIVELMGGVTDAKDIVFSAIKSGKHVITANKALIANHLTEILDLLAQNPTVKFGYEASVCGGIPIIHTLQSAYTGDEVTEIAGIMNGTTNFMLSKMEQQGVGYDEVLKEAQDLGFAEANPSADVDGFDVQSKISILAKLGFGCIVPPSEVPTTGISRITSVDFQYAKMMDSTIKLLGIAKIIKPANSTDNEKVAIYVSPVVVPNSNVIASIHGATNLVSIKSERLINSSYVGEGAGRYPTANSVINDICQVALGLAPEVPFNATIPSRTLESDYQSRFYVRMNISDQVGIIRVIGGLAEKAGVSIFSILQAPIHDPKNMDFVVTTDTTSLVNVQKLGEEIASQPFVLEKPLIFPILEGN